MKIMLKLFAILTAVALYVAPASAKPLQIFVPSSEGGTSYQAALFLEKQLKAKGFETKLNVRGDCVNAVGPLFKQKIPTIMPFAGGDMWTKGCSAFTAKDVDTKVIAPLFKAVGGLCTMDKNLKIADLKALGTVAVAVDYSRVDDLAKFSNSLGFKTKAVVYKSSGSTIKGLIAGDTKLSYTNARTNKGVIKAGGTCLAVTGDRSLKGTPSVLSINKNAADIPSSYYILWGVNLNNETKTEVVKAINELRESADFKKFVDSKWVLDLSSKEEQQYKSIIKDALAKSSK